MCRFFEIEKRGGITIATFTISDIHDQVVVENVGEEILGLINRGTKIILDWGFVEFYTFDGLGYILGLQRRVEEKGGKLVSCSMTDIVRKVFSRTNHSNLFCIVNNREEAIQELRQKQPS